MHVKYSELNNSDNPDLLDKDKKNNEKLKKVEDILKNVKNEELVGDILNKLSKNKNHINSLDNIFSEIDLNLKGKSHLNKNDILDSIKLDEPIDKEYYSSITDSKDFKKRKIAIENSDEILKEKIEPLAEKYDQEYKLSFKLRNKARFIMGMSKKYSKKSDNEKDSNNQLNEEESIDYQNNLEEEITLNTGIDDDMIGIFKKRIKEEKEKKGRGLLIPFSQENEEKKIPKLIKAMKLGLRVVLLCDSGTPTISDPGYRLVKEAAKNGIIIEPLPGPSAVITALSASALPTDKFIFFGFLPKNTNERLEKLEEIKQIGLTSIIFESPMRLQSSLNLIEDSYGENHEIYIGLELTKRYENHLHGTIKNVKKDLIKLFLEKNEQNFENENIFKDKELNIKGEITMILGPIKKSREEYMEEKNLKENINIDIVEFTRRLNKYVDLDEKVMREILIKVCEIPKIKTTKIINAVKNRKTNLQQTLDTITLSNKNFYKTMKYNNDDPNMLEEQERKNPSVKNIKSIKFK